MKTGSGLATALAAGFASPALAETILLAWGTAFESGEHMIAATYNGTVLKTACSDTIKVGSVEISVDSDETVRGTVTVTPAKGDPRTFDLTDDSVCEGFWTAHAAQLECNIPWEDEFEDQDGSALVRRKDTVLETMDTCFSTYEFHKRPMPFGEDLFDLEASDSLDSDIEWIDGADMNSSSVDEEGLDKRQTAPNCGTQVEDTIYTPRSPRKWRRYAQQTGNMDCDVMDCSATHAESVSVSLGFSVSANIGKWLTGGFDVSKSKGYSDSYGCSGKPGDWLCVKHMSRFQGYDMKHKEMRNCGIGTTEWKVHVRSPLNHDAEAHFYCARGTHACKGTWNVFWDDRGNGIHSGA